MSAENVLINFIGDVSALVPVEDALESIMRSDRALGESWKEKKIHCISMYQTISKAI